jgi:hypothetical protein
MPNEGMVRHHALEISTVRMPLEMVGFLKFYNFFFQHLCIKDDEK